jgi:hypothetical protein
MFRSDLLTLLFKLISHKCINISVNCLVIVALIAKFRDIEQKISLIQVDAFQSINELLAKEDPVLREPALKCLLMLVRNRE